MKNLNEYLEYVKSVLATVDRSQAKASYDTGFGLSIVDEYLGDQCHFMDVRQAEIVKINPPDIKDFDQWDIAWQAGKKLVREFTGELS